MIFQDWSKVNQWNESVHNLGFLLRQASTLWRRKLEMVLLPLNITYMQFILLGNLSWHEHFKKNPSQIELAKFCKIDANMTSQALQNLEKKGYLERIHKPHNEKIKIPKLTQLGKSVIKQAVPLVRREDRKFFSSLSMELKPFEEFLQKLIKHNISY